MSYKIQLSTINGSTGQLAAITTTAQKIRAGSIMTQAYVKIGMIMGTACLETVAYTCTTEAIIKQGGSWRRISKSQKEKDGNAL
jgi:hypothetical protein